MENRRQHYRHEFAPTRQFAVRLKASEGHSTLQGELINLSTGGMCIYAPALKTERTEKWIATLTLEAGAAPLDIPVERVYVKDRDGACFGFRFVDPDDLPAREEREKVIWTFLLTEQRRRRQFLRGE